MFISKGSNKHKERPRRKSFSGEVLLCTLQLRVVGVDWLLAVADRLAEYDDHRLLQAECLDDLLLIPAATRATTQARAGAIEIDILRHIAHIDIRHRVGIAGAMARARLVGVGDEEQVEVSVGRLATPRDGAVVALGKQLERMVLVVVVVSTELEEGVELDLLAVRSGRGGAPAVGTIHAQGCPHQVGDILQGNLLVGKALRRFAVFECLHQPHALGVGRGVESDDLRGSLPHGAHRAGEGQKQRGKC